MLMIGIHISVSVIFIHVDRISSTNTLFNKLVYSFLKSNLGLLVSPAYKTKIQVEKKLGGH